METTLGYNPRNGVPTSQWMDTFYAKYWKEMSLARRQAELDERLAFYAWLAENVIANRDVWTLIKAKWRLLQLLTIGQRGLGRPFNFEIDGISYTSRRYRLK